MYPGTTLRLYTRFCKTAGQLFGSWSCCGEESVWGDASTCGLGQNWKCGASPEHTDCVNSFFGQEFLNLGFRAGRPVPGYPVPGYPVPGTYN
eukprot:1998580-Rhodomonas_salina.1